MHENCLRNLRPPWKPGETGNVNGLGGHPKGIVNAKTVLTGSILTDLQEMWSALTVKEKVDWARKNMGQFMAIAVKHLVESVQPVGLDAQDIAVLKAIKEAIPNADRMSAEQVLQHVQDAVQAFESKVVLALPKPEPEKKGGHDPLEGGRWNRRDSKRQSARDPDLRISLHFWGKEHTMKTP
jgi:hypothetical protein